MSERVVVPVRVHKNQKWGWLSGICPDHEIIGYDFKLVNPQYSFLGDHRVRLYKVKGNVHFKVPIGASFDISAVPAATPWQQQHGRRHHKG
jgi:hypothetical protein